MPAPKLNICQQVATSDFQIKALCPFSASLSQEDIYSLNEREIIWKTKEYIRNLLELLSFWVCSLIGLYFGNYR